MNSQALTTPTSFQGLFAILPMLPWEGPPLPRVLGLRWPWSGQAVSAPFKVEDFFRGTFEFTNGREVSGGRDETELIRDLEGNILKVIKRRVPGAG